MTKQRRSFNRKQRQEDQKSTRTVDKKESLKDDFKLDWFTPSDKQKQIVISMNENDLTIVNAPSGTGKCFGKGTQVMMANGFYTKVEDIKSGDEVLGIDGKPRKVLETHKGVDKLYKVSQVKGCEYIVNSQHILSLKVRTEMPNRGLKKGDIHNIPVEDYIRYSRNTKNLLKGWVPSEPMEFSENKTEIDPYILGVWLGDGTTSKPQICFSNKDVILEEYFLGYLRSKGHTHNICPSNIRESTITIDAYGGFYKELKNYDLIGKKRIPKEFLLNSVSTRKEILAGIIDTDGYLSENCCIDLVVKEELLKEDIIFLCRSLGLKVKEVKQFKKCQNFSGAWYNRLSISGDLDQIPTKLIRKTSSERKQVKDFSVTGITVEPYGEGEFFGFSIDGDHLFLLKDFTVVHNSSTVLHKALLDYRYGKYEKIVLIKTPSEAGDDQIGFLSGDKKSKLEAHFASMESIFHQFMSKNKLINDKANENIILDVPNYLLGKTIDNAVIIIEEAQTCSPNTIKLISERAGEGSVVVVVGDGMQRYSVKKRVNGMQDLIDKVTHNDYTIPLPKYESVGYIELGSDDNMRSSLSKFITEIYRDA